MMISAEAPIQVRKAVALLWVDFLLAAIDNTIFLTAPDAEIENVFSFFLAAHCFFFAVGTALIYFVSKRHNWARVTYLVLTIVSAPVYALLCWLELSWSDITYAITSSFLEAVALVWLFSGAGAEWYKTRKPR